MTKHATVAIPSSAPNPMVPATPAAASSKLEDKPKPGYAEPGQARVQALRMMWPIVCRRLEELPNIDATQLFGELSIQFPGRFTRKHYKSLVRRVSLWREDARARGVVIRAKTYRRLKDRPRGRRPDIFREHWGEMTQHLEKQPDQTALELLVEFQARYPDRYGLRQLHTLQRRVRAWRRQAVQRLITDISSLTPHIAADASRLVAGNVLSEASGNKVR